ncbi:VTT domain-containing protein [Halomonas sp. WWR20]
MNYTEWLYQLSPSPLLLLLIILLIALCESLAVIGIVVPGVVLITAAASLAGHQQIALGLVLASGFVGAVIGDGLSFWLGHSQRERVPSLWPFNRHPEWLERSKAFFNRYGSLSILIGRFVGPVRPLIPLVAGMLRMPTGRFVWVNALSALAWAPAYLLPGYLLGRSWQRLLDIPPGADRWLLMLAALTAVLGVIFSWLRYHLGREGWLYRHAARLAQGGSWRRGLWNALSSPRPRQEFPLASLSLLVISLTALCAWTLWVMRTDGPLLMDLQIHSLMLLFKFELLASISHVMMLSGDVVGVIALTLPWLLWLLRAHHFAAFLHLVSALAGVTTANIVLRQLSGGASPDTSVHLTGPLTYPDALTSTVVVVYGLAAAFSAQELPSYRRAYAYWCAVVICLLMALSRLIAGEAWLSDVIGGALLGLTVCAVARVSYHRFAHAPLTSPPWLTLGLTSLGLLAARILWLPAV